MATELHSYRPEIDGLRAIAVLAVVLAHAGLEVQGYSLLPGGHLGVDIFFVISGYVITRLISQDLTLDRFSFQNFYTRRIRRIIPALTVVLLASAGAAWIVLPPGPFLDFGRSLLAVVAFVANIYFSRQDDYFAEPSETTALLHTWSLAVEEQFYLLFPLIMLLVWRRARNHLFVVVALLAAASFIHYLYDSQTEPGAAYFLVQNRTWQILTGALVALIEWKTGADKNSPLALAGLALVLAALIWLGEPRSDAIAGPIAAVAGAALLIRYGASTPIARMLSVRPLVFVGLISYSLYLWHQPVFTFARLNSVDDLASGTLLLLIAACIVLAFMTWLLVEQPFRKAGMPFSRLFGFFIVAQSSLALIAFTVLSSAGFPQRYTEAQQKLLETNIKRGTAEHNGKPCHRRLDHPCIIGASGRVPTVAVIGDSHADTLTGPIGDALARTGHAAFVYTLPGCPFIMRAVRKGLKVKCGDFVEKVIGKLQTSGIRNVILHERFSIYLMGSRFDNGEGGSERGRIDVRPEGFSGKEPDRIAALSDAWIETMNRFKGLGIRVHYILPVPEAGWHVPRTIVKLMSANRLPLTTSRERYLDRHKIILGMAAGLQQAGHFEAYYPHKVFCSEASGRCLTHDEDSVFYVDTNHMSDAGARKLIDTITADPRFDLGPPDAQIKQTKKMPSNSRESQPR